jgi:hypothetical protein
MANKVRCKVEGCNRQLDEYGYPVEFCDWQQGRCPMQKQKLDTVGYIVITFMFITLFIILWLIT